MVVEVQTRHGIEEHKRFTKGRNIRGDWRTRSIVLIFSLSFNILSSENFSSYQMHPTLANACDNVL